MIILNDKAFAESEQEFTNSLFNPINGCTCAGYAKRLKRQIKLFDHQRKLVGVINKYGVLCCAHVLENGKVWYNFADIPLIGKYESYTRSVEEPVSYATQTDYKGFDRVYQFN